jgi:ABC-type multidrug transport system permease subunit
VCFCCGFTHTVPCRRLVVYKHRDASFYSPAAYFMSLVIFDIPFMILETFLFTVLVYWMASEYREGKGCT